MQNVNGKENIFKFGVEWTGAGKCAFLRAKAATAFSAS